MLQGDPMRVDRDADPVAPARGTIRVYGPEREPGPILEAACWAPACWAHARRKLFELAAVSKAPIAAEAVRRIDELFAIERDISGKPAAERLAVREERAKPLVIELEAWLRAQHGRVSRKSETGKAIAYALNHWEALSPLSRGWADLHEQQRGRARVARGGRRPEESDVRRFRSRRGARGGGLHPGRDLQESRRLARWR